MPDIYRIHVLRENESNLVPDLVPENDPYCLATIKHYRSLIPMAQEVRQPIFKLTSADGAFGAHAEAVQEAYNDFRILAQKIKDKMKEANLTLKL
jgi:hypothetical protein